MYKNYTRKRGMTLPCFQKILLIMRLTTVILIVAIMQVSASGFAQKVTFKAKAGSLKQLFTEIKKQTGYNVVWKTDELNSAKPINVDFVNTALEDVLKISLSNQSLDYTIEKKTIVIRQKEPSLLDRVISTFADIDVRGRILDEKGQGLPGATVKVKGSSKTTVTNSDGEFMLQGVDENAIIVMSYLGYKTAELKAKQDLGAITLVADSGNLLEVNVTVNTGYQSLTRERSAGSFAKPDREALANRSTSMNVLQRLDGLVPGLTVNSAPGSESILIRGLNSINSNRSPLIVVDGIPTSNINSINPQDVADVTVLKDATAASIWGAKASNGVVVITTKKGTSSEGIKVNYDGFFSFQGKPDLDYLPVLNSQQYIQAAREVFDPVTFPWNTASAYTLGAIGMPPHELILYNQYRGLRSAAQTNTSLDSLAGLSNKGQIEDLWYRNAALMNHTVSLTGGGKIYSFYGSASYTDAKSNRPGAQDRTYKVNLRQDFNFNKILKAYVITDLTNNVSSSPRNVSVDTRFYPYQLFRDGNGNSLSMPYVASLTDSTRKAAEARSRLSLDYRPLDDAGLAASRTNNLLNRMVGGITVQPLKFLKYEGVFGYVRGHNKNSLYDDNSSFVQRNELVQFTVAATPSVAPVYYLPTSGGKYTVNNSLQKEWTIRNQFIFDQSWKQSLHQLTLLAGQEAQEQMLTLNQSIARGYDHQLRNAIPVDYAALSLGLNNPIVANNLNRSVLSSDFYSETEAQTRFSSYYANAAYTYALKYSLNASWRVDKSNLFGLDKGAQGKPVWSAGVKWLMSEEQFMKGVPFLDYLALRATYGVTGNSPIPGTASSYNILSAATSASLPGGRSFSVATPGNPSLTWERTKTTNIGFDFNLLKNRLSGSFDYYNKKTDDLVGQLPSNTLTGYSVIVGNYGSLKNNGIEAVLNSVNINSADFRWTTSLNLAYNKNEITGINYLTPITTGQQMINQRYFPGYSAFALFAYQYAGLDALGDPQIILADGSVSKARNISKPVDMRYMGTTQPPLSGGLSNTFSYKGFSLSANAVFNLGHVMRRDVGTYFSGRLIGSNALVLAAGRYTSSVNLAQGNVNSIFAERWKQSGDENTTNVPSYVSNTSLSNSRRDVNYYTYGDLNVLDASYIKLRDVTLSYRLPKSVLSNIKVSDITFRMQVSNLMLWKANRYGIDPEFQGFNLGVASGGDPETISGVNRAVRSMQGMVTFGAHASF
ncbi:SusC/RagA family TonB-linked outer membrane protein [Pedobacter sp. GR22-6]|uniref:SusC/RagA family TonB-linked outer membrane protein n=1 Tax=Pedobacter sp. GR22-6 TaxID=3127957 RepID=UPI00307F2601